MVARGGTADPDGERNPWRAAKNHMEPWRATEAGRFRFRHPCGLILLFAATRGFDSLFGSLRPTPGSIRRPYGAELRRRKTRT